MGKLKKLRKRFKYTLIYWGVSLFIRTSYITPRRWWLAFCGALGQLAFFIAGKSSQLAITHLGIAFPEKSAKQLRQMAKETFVMLGKNGGDILRASKVKTQAQFDKFVVAHGMENYERAHEKGKGVIWKMQI